MCTFVVLLYCSYVGLYLYSENIVDCQLQQNSLFCTFVYKLMSTDDGEVYVC